MRLEIASVQPRSLAPDGEVCSHQFVRRGNMSGCASLLPNLIKKRRKTKKQQLHTSHTSGERKSSNCRCSFGPESRRRDDFQQRGIYAEAVQRGRGSWQHNCAEIQGAVWHILPDVPGSNAFVWAPDKCSLFKERVGKWRSGRSVPWRRLISPPFPPPTLPLFI